MTLEEKKKALGDFCRERDECVGCPLYKTDVDCDLLTSGFHISDDKVDRALDILCTAPGVVTFVTDGEQKVAKACDVLPHILDSGNRRQFETGAVRDIQEGKGRCDLLPLYVVGAYYKVVNDGTHDDIYWVFHNINRFKETNDVIHLYRALERFHGFSEHETMFLEVAKHFEEGCKKYGENNWQKGIPTHCYIDSAVRHYLKYLRGDVDEPHDRAFCWNILCCIWTCMYKPELNDYAKKETTNEE